jgi:ipoprotein LpqH
MHNRFVAVATALVFVAGISGCSQQPTAKEQVPGRITVEGNARTTESLECDQHEWLLMIEATAGPAHAQALLQLGGEKPAVRTVNISNFNGFNGVAGEGLGNVDASFADGVYTVTGTAEGSNPDDPGKTRTARFRIEAPC